MEGVGGEVKGGRLVGEGVLLMLATWMRFWLLPSRVSYVLLCPSLLLLLAAASVLHSAAVGGSIIGVVGPL